MRYLIIFLSLVSFAHFGQANAEKLSDHGFSSPEYVNGSCFTTRQYDDGFWIGIGKSINDTDFLLMGHTKWTDLVEGKTYETVVSFSEYGQATLKGIVKSKRGIMYEDVEKKLLNEFSVRPAFFVAFGGMFAGPYNLSGSAFAIKKLEKCIKKYSSVMQSNKVVPAENTAVDYTQLPIRKKVNMRECRADSIVFQDFYAGTTFRVSKVGRKGTYQCGSRFVEEPVNEDCAFFGDTVLSGFISSRNILDAAEGTREAASFIVSVNKSLPCCSTTFFKGSTEDLLVDTEKFSNSSAKFRWFDNNDVPSLEDLGIGLLDARLPKGSTGTGLEYPLYPVECEMDVLFALPEICAEEKSSEKLLPKAGDDGIWWIKGNHLEAHEYSCEIQSYKKGIADVYCDAGDYGNWSDKLKMSVTANEIRIGERSLKRCEF